MYHFIFYFIYKSQLNQKDGGPLVGRYVASLIVLVFLFLHILLLYAFARFFLFNYGNTDISFSIGNTYSKKLIFVLPIFIALTPLIYKHFDKSRIIKIEQRYENQNLYSFFNFIKFFGAFIVPLVIAIVLVNHSIYRGA
jgi:hypothetical protein